MKTAWRVGLLVLLYPLYGCVPGLWPDVGAFGLGLGCLRTAQPDGKPIAGATVAVVMLPEGGSTELERRVQEHQPLYGWVLTTDKRGKAQMPDDSEAASRNRRNPPPARYVFSEASQGYTRDQTSTGEWTSEWPNFDPDDPMGLVILARGFEPFIGTAQLGRQGLMPKLRMMTLAGREPSLKRESATVTMDPIRKVIAGALPEARSEAAE